MKWVTTSWTNDDNVTKKPTCKLPPLVKSCKSKILKNFMMIILLNKHYRKATINIQKCNNLLISEKVETSWPSYLDREHLDGQTPSYNTMAVK